ncbi:MULTISPECIES: type II toxin-antitoxin system YafQ family toxin [unclassified Campylobacter]|nr:type II toxin-antitoxin system YafQ family toxin [Campylobacter sp. 2018MI13]MBT0882989.1 type II toxin-antitoxin system YafQ family toxin [Campylobacter sp. 2018MI13]MBZ7984641.1 type II toxin-antitoxin system YafQ family toxin [Campylobacter sp. RM12647]
MDLKDCRDCHIKNDLVLVYKNKNILIPTCISTINHSKINNLT